MVEDSSTLVVDETLSVEQGVELDAGGSDVRVRIVDSDKDDVTGRDGVPVVEVRLGGPVDVRLVVEAVVLPGGMVFVVDVSPVDAGGMTIVDGVPVELLKP